jgi:AAA domain, putative AbiEii toxin, Type IV TA system
MYRYRITSIVFNDGYSINAGDLTVIIGPNNSGKSRALKDMLNLVTASSIPKVVVHEVTWSIPQSIEELRNAYNVDRYRDANGAWRVRHISPDMSGEIDLSAGAGDWPQRYNLYLKESAPKDPNWFAQHFGPQLVAILTTDQRLNLVEENQNIGDERDEQNLLQLLYTARTETELVIRSRVKDAFQQEIALDYSRPQRLRLRVGADFSKLPPDPRDALRFFEPYESLDDQGDGIRSFVGIVVALTAVKRSLFLIDEPEAFLHPPQSFRVGEFIADQTKQAKQVIVATHSTDVLRGILNRRRDASIVRIDRLGNRNTFRMLNPDRVLDLLTDPLISSARVLDGLFYSAAVVVEADSDARFYQIASRKHRQDADLHFVNADNKQTVPRIMQIYRDMGVRCAGIVDFDVINDRTEFGKQLDALNLDRPELNEAREIQEAIKKAVDNASPEERLKTVKEGLDRISERLSQFQEKSFPTEEAALREKEEFLRWIESRFRELSESTKPWKEFKKCGREALPLVLQPRFDRLAQICSHRGLFINPRGELESMLTQHGIEATGDKRAWIIRALQLMPSLAVDETVYPWAFIKDIHNYLFRTNPTSLP